MRVLLPAETGATRSALVPRLGGISRWRSRDTGEVSRDRGGRRAT